MTWQDTGLRANQVLVMAAALLLERSGGVLIIERAEWARLSSVYGQAGALLISEDDDRIELRLGTVGEVAQGGAHD